jgi:hypothetical protein
MSQTRDRRPEPEIYPPGAPLPRRHSVWMTDDGPRARYVHVARIGPVGLTLLTLGAAAAIGLTTVFLLGAAIIGLAAVGVLTLAGVVAGILRGPPRSLR